jgi:hypothetical protein
VEIAATDTTAAYFYDNLPRTRRRVGNRLDDKRSPTTPKNGSAHCLLLTFTLIDYML